jgi:dUTP pyrophosphatase
LNVPVQLEINGHVPHYASDEAAGADLYATTPTTIGPNTTAMIDTRIKIAIPSGYAGLVVSRSGLAAKNRVVVLNAPGVIDSDYRGNVKVLLWNTHATESFHISREDRIAQLLIISVERANFMMVQNLDKTIRDTGGFGSTGVK